MLCLLLNSKLCRNGSIYEKGNEEGSKTKL